MNLNDNIQVFLPYFIGFIALMLVVYLIVFAFKVTKKKSRTTTDVEMHELTTPLNIDSSHHDHHKSRRHDHHHSHSIKQISLDDNHVSSSPTAPIYEAISAPKEIPTFTELNDIAHQIENKTSRPLTENETSRPLNENETSKHQSHEISKHQPHETTKHQTHETPKENKNKPESSKQNETEVDEVKKYLPSNKTKTVTFTDDDGTKPTTDLDDVPNDPKSKKNRSIMSTFRSKK